MKNCRKCGIEIENNITNPLMQCDKCYESNECPNCPDVELVTRMFDVDGTHDIVEMYTCLECGYKSPEVVK